MREQGQPAQPRGPQGAKEKKDAKERPSIHLLLSDLLKTIALVWQSHKLFTILILLFSLLLAFVPVSNLWVSKLLIDAVAHAITGELSGGFRVLLMLFALQVAISLLSSLFSTVQNSIRELLGDALQNRISYQILEKASGLEVEHFENAQSYDALRNAYREVGSRPLGVLTQLLFMLQALISLSTIGVLLSRLGWSIIPLVFLASLPSVWVSSRFGEQGYRMIRRQAQDARKQNYLGWLLTSDNHVNEIRLFGLEKYMLTNWHSYYKKFRQQLVDLVKRRSYWQLGASFLSTFFIAIPTLGVLRKAAQGLVTIGDFSMFTSGIVQVQQQFATLLMGFSGIYQNLLYMRNLFDFLELPSRDLNAGLHWQEAIETIEFKEVSFHYPLSEKDVLTGVSFSLHKGEVLALVGHNGAGKSTIIKLLSRLYEPTGGQILFNGKDITLYSPRSVQKHMANILQDYGYYQFSIRENIELGEIDAQKEQVAAIDSAKKAEAHDFIMELKEQYESQAGGMFQGGTKLSGGQWQRLALSRLYYREADVLIFDEPASALDPDAEYRMIEELQHHAQGRIAIVISHRFSTVRQSQRILVLEKGRVIEEGSHEELLEVNGLYAHLFNVQAQGYI